MREEDEASRGTATFAATAMASVRVRRLWRRAIGIWDDIDHMDA
jgi:hypothetical protein